MQTEALVCQLDSTHKNDNGNESKFRLDSNSLAPGKVRGSELGGSEARNAVTDNNNRKCRDREGNMRYSILTILVSPVNY
jgi:hypothetical protein